MGYSKSIINVLENTDTQDRRDTDVIRKRLGEKNLYHQSE